MVDIKNNSEAVPGENERFKELGRGCYAYSADGCSNTGVIVGERGVLIVDGQATPAMAEKTLQKLREITDKPVKQVVLTHFHADSSLGAQLFEPGDIIASDLTQRMIDTRGAQDIQVSRERDPVLFADLAADARVCKPSMTIASSMTIDLGGLEVRLMHLGRGHTMGDLVVWVPQSGVIFAGDLVQKSAAPYCGDAHLSDWPRALDRISAFRPTALMPGRGKPAIGTSAVAAAIETTREFVITLRDTAAACVEQSLGLKDTFLAIKDALAPQFASKPDFDFHLPLNVARAYDEALGLDQPQIWTRERCADLIDALNGVISAGEEVASEETPQPDTVPEMEPEVEEAAEEVDQADASGGEAAESTSPELVSDSDFAASLELVSDGDEPDGEEVPLDLAADDIIEDEGDPQEETASEEAEEAGGKDRKVLEEVR